jgi:hypothetical protein
MSNASERVSDPISDIFAITIDSFLKFQLKRKALGKDGTDNFIKQVNKVVVDINDEIIAASIRYARKELDTNEVFVTFDEEVRAIVLADLMSAFKKISSDKASESDDKLKETEA